MSSDPRHLEPEEIAAYRQRTLSPADLLRADDHLAGCGMCRDRLGDSARVTRAVAAIHRSLADADGALEHPPADQLAAFVDGGLDEVDRELIEAHLELCDSCAGDAEDLRALGSEIRSAHPPAAGPRARRWPAYAGIGALAAGLAGVLVWTGLLPVPGRGPDPPATHAPSGAPPPHAPPTAPPRLTLSDGSVGLTLHADGTLSGVPLREDEAEAVREALEEGRIAIPSGVRALAGSRGTLMAVPSTSPALRVLRPVATAVESDRPVFEWTTLPGAATFVVSVFDEDFEKVAESPPLTGGSWQPSRALARGRTYQWQVRAETAGDQMVAPSPPSPEARFQVLPRTEADRLAEVRARLGDSPLALGILLARAGVLDSAEGALAQGVAANPGALEPARLLERVRAARANRPPR